MGFLHWQIKGRSLFGYKKFLFGLELASIFPGNSQYLFLSLYVVPKNFFPMASLRALLHQSFNILSPNVLISLSVAILFPVSIPYSVY